MPLAMADVTESSNNPGNFQCKGKSKVAHDRKAEVHQTSYNSQDFTKFSWNMYFVAPLTGKYVPKLKFLVEHPGLSYASLVHLFTW